MGGLRNYFVYDLVEVSAGDLFSAAAVRLLCKCPVRTIVFDPYPAHQMSCFEWQAERYRVPKQFCILRDLPHMQVPCLDLLGSIILAQVLGVISPPSRILGNWCGYSLDFTLQMPRYGVCGSSKTLCIVERWRQLYQMLIRCIVRGISCIS